MLSPEQVEAAVCVRAAQIRKQDGTVTDDVRRRWQSGGSWGALRRLWPQQTET